RQPGIIYISPKYPCLQLYGQCRHGQRMNAKVVFSRHRSAFLIQKPSSRRKPGPNWYSTNLDSGFRLNEREAWPRDTMWGFQPLAIPKSFTQSPRKHSQPDARRLKYAGRFPLSVLNNFLKQEKNER
ncbi:hypothetical protein, partial [Propionivibrio sp.]|uniref:hypothetical protein n=1 Tax=Propionivibrio sp. TaxID=2212460 RepID=UPI0025F4D626